MFTFYRESESPMKRWFKHPFDIFIFHTTFQYIYNIHIAFFPCLATWVQNDVSYNNVNAWNDEEEEGGESVSHSSSNGRIFHHVPGIWPQIGPKSGSEYLLGGHFIEIDKKALSQLFMHYAYWMILFNFSIAFDGKSLMTSRLRYVTSIM